MATFGLKYYAELRSKYKNIIWRVEIAERGYSGSSEMMTFAGNSPLQITWEKRGDDFTAPVKASEASIKIMCFENFHYLSLFTSDARKFRVSIFRGGVLYWRGFITADLYSESFTAPPYEVTIKAVDGFNLLSGYIFKDLMNIGTKGRKTLWELLSKCIDLLELDMTVSDWLDIFAEGMNETTSPLKQTCIDLERLYFVYENPTYRDVLELCLLPFAAQIFQSNGALHIRRAVALYETSRPSTFFQIGGEYPSGYVTVDEDKTFLAADQNSLIVTTSAREVMDEMWNGNLNVLGESILDIAPALRHISVNIKNKELGDLIGQMGYYNPAKWNDTNELLAFNLDIPNLQMSGDDDHMNIILSTSGCSVKRCSYALTWEFNISTYYQTWTAGSYSRPTQNYAISVYYGIKVVGTSETYYLTESGDWSDTETNLVTEVKTGDAQTMKIDINGIPCDGTWHFYIVQTLKGKVTSYINRGQRVTSGYMQRVTFSKMTLRIDAGELYEDGLSEEILINAANNTDLSISLPISDIPDIPNDHLLYSLYYLYTDGTPTRLWHTRGRSDHETLIGHLVMQALRFMQLPSRRITGDIFTKLHVDLNTVIKDGIFTKTGYLVNSIELNALDDTYNSELVEMPRLFETDTPAAGDDCICVATFDFSVKKVIRCMNYILIQTTSNRIILFDSISRTLREVFSSSYSFNLFSADNGFIVEQNGTFQYMDHRGIIQRTLTTDDYDTGLYNGWATFMNGYFVLLYKTARVGANYTAPYVYLTRPEINSSGSYSRTGTATYDSKSYAALNGTAQSVCRGENAIVINLTNGESHICDTRLYRIGGHDLVGESMETISVSDHYLIANAYDDKILLFERTSIEEFTQLDVLGEYATLCDHNLSMVARYYEEVAVYDIHSGTTTYVKNIHRTDEDVHGLFIIYGDLYIVRGGAIYKYIKQS